jgi:hypothetical protein
MPSKSSLPRTRGWSSESMGSSVDLAAFAGNATHTAAMTASTRSLCAPLKSVCVPPLRQQHCPAVPCVDKPQRQPSNPHEDNNVQRDAGFARFLKKHSSPTHNRVTAGGRIVPMEKAQSPPKFDLTPGVNSLDVLRKVDRDDLAPALGHLPNAGDLRGEDVDPTKTLHSPAFLREYAQLRSQGERLEEIKDIHPAMDTGYMAHHQSVASGSAATPSNSFYGVAPIGIFPPAMGPVFPSQPMIPGYPPMGNFAWPSPTYQTPPAHEQSMFAGVELSTQLLVTAQSLLAQAEAHFDNLDRQLKLIDRHRAMTRHDPNVSVQRMAIVEQRAQAKDLVSRLRAQVESLQATTGPPTPARQNLAGTAPSFVPSTNTKYTQTQPISASGSIDILTDASRSSGDRDNQKSKRKIIPIVAPPAGVNGKLHSSKGHASTGSTTDSSNSAPETKSVPRQVCEAKTKTQSHAEPLEATRMQPSSFRSSDCDGSGTRQFSEPQILGWAKGKPETLPSELQGMTEMYYDALRLPEGTLTIFNLDNGARFEVRGVDMQAPFKDDMDEAEREYWTRKPAMTEAMLEKLKSIATVVKETEYLTRNVAGSGHKTRHSTSCEIRDTVMKSDDDQILRDDEYSRDMQEHLINVLEGSFQHMKLDINTALEPPAIDVASQGEHSAEELSNKGYSSVSVQNVHATVRLPPSFDGTIDHTNRDNKAKLPASKKSRASNVLHRVSPAGVQ